MIRRTRRHRSHKRSTTLHRRRYGKGRKSGRKCRKTRRMRGGDIDISLAGDEFGYKSSMTSHDSGLKLVENLFSEKDKGKLYYIKLKTNDGFVSRKYLLDNMIMAYIRDYSSNKNPKIETVTLCEDDSEWDGIGFDKGQFIREYQRRPKTKSNGS
jgi:hypothetical protein